MAAIEVGICCIRDGDKGEGEGDITKEGGLGREHCIATLLDTS
jgi:hypothetical protein